MARAAIEHRARILAAIALGALLAGGLAHLEGDAATGDDIWRAAVALLAAALAVEVGRTIVVEHHMGVDTIALVADAVITVDRVDRVADALHAGRRALHIARQSVLIGMGLSLAAMLVAAAGYLPPAAGALLQEGIDLAVILNALRALYG